jgi:hypothetical protein
MITLKTMSDILDTIIYNYLKVYSYNKEMFRIRVWSVNMHTAAKLLLVRSIKVWVLL